MKKAPRKNKRAPAQGTAATTEAPEGAEVVAAPPAGAVRAEQPKAAPKDAPKGPKPTLAQQIAAKVAAGELQVPPSHEA